MRYWLLGIVAVAVIALVWALRSQEVPASHVATQNQGRIVKSDDAWRAILSAEQFQVTRRKGTERAFSGKYATAKVDGVFHCVCCDQPLFDTRTKYDSGTGWPSFWQPIDEANVSLVPDNSGWLRRTEVVCSRCDAHLGHVFNDGPAPTGLRYCMNSAALTLADRKESQGK